MIYINFRIGSAEINREKIFQDIDNHLCKDEKPSIYLADLFRDEQINRTYPFTLLADLKTVEQSPRHHPEGNVWNHTLMVVDCAAARKQLSKNPRVLMWASLLHDLGKVPATSVRGGRITAYDHDKWSEKLALNFLKEFTEDEKFMLAVAKMVRWHMQILFVVKKLPFAELESMVKEVDIDELGLLSLCDRLGRGELSEHQMNEEHENLAFFLNQCQQIQVENVQQL